MCAGKIAICWGVHQMSKINSALIGAIALLLSTSALADIPPPKPEPAPDSANTSQPSSDQTSPSPATDATTPAPSKEDQIAASLVKREGVISLPGGQATVTISEGFAYL